MGQLHDRDAWARELKDVVVKLEDWVEGELFDLGHREWFADGRSGSPVARAVRVHENDDTDQVVLKFFARDGKTRVQNIRRGWKNAGEFQKHLAEAQDQGIPLGTWRAVFLHIARGNLDDVEPLAKHFWDDDFLEQCATIIRSIITDWNGNRLPTDPKNPRTVAEVLGDIMGHRQSAAEKWARDFGFPVDGAPRRVPRMEWPEEELPNPFTLVYGTEGGYDVEDLMIGKAHGDLSGRNVLVPGTSEILPDEYVLIDYDRYSDAAPLARDPMHLLVALTLDKLDDFKPQFHSALAKVIVDPDAPGIPQVVIHVKKLSAAIHAASRKLAVDKGMGAQWSRQCLLSLVGAGLVHLGRELRTEDENAAKVWCFQVAARATESYLRKRPRRDRDAAANAPPSTVSRDTEGIVDRQGDVHTLWARLTGGPWGIVVLRGNRGVGKTKLVDTVLEKFRQTTAGWPGPRIRRHDVRATARLDAHTLIDHVQGDTDTAVPRQPGRSSLARLELTLRELGESPVVVAVDSAEELLDPDTKKLVDLELDETLELIAEEQGHRVAVLLVTQHDPASPTKGTWPTAETPLYLRKLPSREFFQYLAGLDRAGRTDPGGLLEEFQQVLYSKLQGNPRLAELAHAVVVVVQSGLDLRALAEQLRAQDTKYVQTVLTRLLVEHSTALQQHVLEAIAAFDIPVPVAAVVGLLEDRFPEEYRPEQVGQVLSTLVANRIVYRVEEDQYVVPPEDARLILDRMENDEDRTDTYFCAAEQLEKLRHKEPRRFVDLRVHFAELTALLLAEQPLAGYELIEAIDELLAEWSCRYLLLKQRKEVRTRLREDQEMANENALGLIHTALGEFDDADAAYGKAMKLADEQRDSDAKLRLLGNLATMYWERNDILRALSEYEFVRDEAERLNKPHVRMVALEGIADCHRRSGNYHKAIGYAEEARSIPALANYPDTPEARNIATSRSVTVMLKLARWFGELGEVHRAESFIDSIRDLSKSSDWLKAVYLDGYADMLFDRGDLELAESKALAAEEEALRQQDPIVLVQARTTLSFFYLKKERHREARLAIKGAWRYRRHRRSLVVLALHALATRQVRNPEADDLFRQLHAESSGRIKHNGRDFAAWHYKGFAICGQRLDSRDDLDEAVEALRIARSIPPPTPALDERLKLMFTRLDQCGHRSGRLSHVIDELA